MQVLHLSNFWSNAELLAALQGLSSLTMLVLSPVGCPAQGLEVACQLTGPKRLDVCDKLGYNNMLVLQLTQLRQLTALKFTGYLDMKSVTLQFSHQVSYRGRSCVS
jgi:hypothetical protein